MTKLLAMTALLALLLLCSLGNYWYTFGLWPKSWMAFAGFAFLSGLLTNAVKTVLDDKD